MWESVVLGWEANLSKLDPPRNLRSNISVEEYELASRKKFAEDNVLYDSIIYYQQTKRHVNNIIAAERERIWRRSSCFEWNEEGKLFYNYRLYIQ
ncbi:hypothetical protein E2C01_059710 [Portunus trituberculatus]|uniref:Uncharacterized protein n=1 Tax=Portunus trituberculatus TaxID=210409 RepID=A0A5B7H3B8_PORTR|nr:hypothetical protein [Portunus trituberculatus]